MSLHVVSQCCYMSVEFLRPRFMHPKREKYTKLKYLYLQFHVKDPVADLLKDKFEKKMLKLI